MSEVTQFAIGSDVECSDGPCGRLLSVVVNPVANAVTHIIVEPEHRFGLGRLVPIDLVGSSEAKVALRCTKAEFDDLPRAEETHFLSDNGTEWGYDDDVHVWPYQGLEVGRPGVVDDFGGNAPVAISYDKLPVGEVEVRRGDEVHATDGNIGRVQGLVLDPRDHGVTHVLLQEGHLWGRKQVAIPITDVAGVDEDGIRLGIAKEDVRNLPPVQVG